MELIKILFDYLKKKPVLLNSVTKTISPDIQTLESVGQHN